MNLNPMSIPAVLAFAVSVPQVGRAEAEPVFSVVDGRDQSALISVPVAQASGENKGIKVEQSLTSAAGKPGIWKTKITNAGTDQRWLLLRWNLTWDGADKLEDLSYWNGRRDPVKGQGLLSASGPAAITAGSGTMMLQTIYGKSQGLSLALSPREIVSDFEHSIRVVPGAGVNGAGRKLQLQLQIPLVLDPGQSDVFPVEIYRFKPRYGFLDAIQSYYNAHPESFWPRQNVDPRVRGVGAAYTAWNYYSYEKTRRFGGDWEWGYAPYRRSGDLYGRPELWEYKPGRPIHEPFASFTPEQYRAWRNKRFDKSNAAGVATLFYTPSFFYVEEGLAKEHYPDAILRNPDGSPSVYTTTPNVTGYDNEYMLFPGEKKYMTQICKDAAQIMAETNTAGFAYDVADGGVLFRGKGTEGLSRRGFDAFGPCLDVSVGVAQMMDFTRGLKKNGLQAGLVANPTGNSRAFLAARCDSAMYERAPYKVMDEIIPLRYNLGHKTLTWWSGWNISDMVKTGEMSPAELKEAYSGAADYAKLMSYRYGAFPSVLLSCGVPELVNTIPRLKEVIEAGWQAVPAMRTARGPLPAEIWGGRYGEGQGSYLTLGNTLQEKWSGEIIVDNDYLGPDNYLFVSTAGTALPQRVVGRTTRFAVNLKPHESLVLRAVAKCSPAATGAVTLRWEDNGARGGLASNGGMKIEGIRPLRRNWIAGDVTATRWVFTSPVYGSARAEILGFPYLKAAILLPAKPSADEQWVATRLQEYFKFWGENAHQPARTIELKIYLGKAPTAEQPLIVVGGNAKSITRKGDRLYLGSRTPASLRDATAQLLGALDLQFPYYGHFPGLGEGPDEAAVIKKAGLTGGLMGQQP